MDVHYVGKGSMFTECGMTVSGREQLAQTDKKRMVTCVICKAGLS